MDDVTPEPSTGGESGSPRWPGRRLLLAAAVAVVAAGGVTSVGVLAANASTAPTTKTAGGKQTTVTAADKAAAAARAAAPAGAGSGTSTAPLGAVISTGITSAAGETVFYAVAISDKALPHTHFGIMAGHREAGKITDDIVVNEFSGSDKAPGFHGVEGASNANGVNVPEFGYYAGPAAKITGTVGGRPVRAHQAAWSEDAHIIVFWFDPGAKATKLAAYDASGKKLPTGHREVGQG